MFTNNISFTPIRQPEATETLETPDEIFNRGLYYYANQDREKNLIDKEEDILDRERPYKDKAADIFGTNYIPFNDVTNRNYFLGNALIARKGFANNPYGYAMQHEPDLVKTGKSAEDILSAIGGKEIERQRKIYDDRIAKQQAIEARQREAEKALNETYQQLPTEIAKIIRAGSNLTKLRDSKLKSEEVLAKIPENIASTKTGTIKKAWEDSATRVKGKIAQNEQEIAKLEEYLKDDVPLPPEMLDKLTKYQASDNAIASVQRAKTAWQYAFPLMGDNGFVKRQSYQSLVQIAKALTDESGNLDEVALASFAIAMHEEAKERQAEHPDPYARFWSALKNAFSNTDDARIHTDMATHAYHDMIKEGASVEEATAFADALKGKNVETLRSIWLEAVDMSMEPSERANWHASMLSSLAGVVGEQVIPLVGAVAGAAITRGASGTMQLGRIGKNAINYFGGWAGGAAATYPGLYSRAYSNAVRDGKINPEAYAANEAIAQAASEGAFSAVTTLRPISKGVGTALNYGLSRAGGSKIASNAAAISIASWLGGSMLEGSLELLEEELSGIGGTTLNALSRACGVEVSPQTYKLGEALGQMKSYEIAAFYTYAALFGGAQLPNNYRNARKFATNTERLLDAGHTPEAAREVQYHVLQAEEQLAEIQSDDKLTPYQKLQQQTKVEEACFAKQKEILIGDITNANPEKVRKRLEARGEKHLTQGELTSAINGKVAENIFKQFGIIEAMPEAGNKYRVVFETEEETKEDGTKTAPKLVVKEWTRNQLVNFLQIKQTDLLQKHTRAFQSLVKAKASAQNVTIDGLKVEFQNMRDTPLEAYAALEKYNAITEEFIFEAANIARNLITERQAGGMTFEEALSSPSGLFHGISLGEVAALDSAAQQRKRQEAATTSGQMQGISESSKVEYGGINFYRPDGSVLVAYASSRANTNDIMEELLEGLLKHHIATGKVTMQQLETFLRDMDEKLPGVSILPTNKAKDEYTQSDFIEAYSKLALSNYLYDEAYLPLNEEEHQLLREIGQTVDAARILKTIGDAYHTFINSDEGKKYLADGGKTLDEILRDAGFAVGEVVAKAKTTAEQEIKIAEERDWIPSVERQIEELMTEAQAEEQLTETNEQEAKEPTIIPAEESITGEEITVEPTSEQETLVSPDETPESHLRNLITQGKAKTQDFARFFRDTPSITDAEATAKGLRPLTQKGSPAAAYTQGRLIADKLTPQQFDDYINGKLKGKDLKKILTPPEVRQPIESTQEQEQTTPQEQTQEAALEDAEKNVPRTPASDLQDAGRHIFANKDAARKLADKLMEELPEDIARISLATYFPAPNYEKLINDGLDQKSVALLCYLRNTLPDKPRGSKLSWKGRDWVKILDLHRQLARAILTGELDADAILARLDEYHDQTNSDRDYTHNIYASVGWPVCANIPKDVHVSYGRVWTRDKGSFLGFSVTQGKYHLAYTSESLSEIVLYFHLKYARDASNDSKQPKSTAKKKKFYIYSYRTNAGLTYHVGAEIPGGVHVKLSDNFADQKTARAYLDANQEAIAELYKNLQKDPDTRAVVNTARVGKDYRQGKNVDNETFMRTFGINGITYGNWVAGAARQAKLNACYDAFMDLAVILGIPPRAISLNGSLGIQFGAAGRRGSAAHYRPADVAINLNRDTGDGSLAHEWWHALDNYFMRQGGRAGAFASDAAQQPSKPMPGGFMPIARFMEVNGFMNERAAQAYHNLITAVRNSQYKLRSERRKNKAYWGSNIELTARLFEAYVRDKIKDIGQNDYLARFHDQEVFEASDKEFMESTGKSRYPYPTNEEMQTFRPLLDEFFSSLTHTSQDDGNVVTFSVKPAQETPNSIFVKDQVGVRMLNHVRMEAKRFARVFGDKQPYEQAVNAVQSALAIIGAVDKYMHAPDKPVAQKYRNRLTKLRSIVEKYAQIINTGKERSFKKISAAEQKELDAAIAELEQAEIESAITESDKLIESEDKLNKKTREARAKEHKRNIVRHAAKGRVYASLAEMLNVAGDVLDDYLKARTIKQMKRITDAVKIKRTPSKRLKGKMTAPAYRELERAIELMALSQRAYEEQQSNVSFAQDVLAKAIKENDSNITQGNVLLTELAKELEQQGVKVTPRTLTDALVNYASSLTVYGCLDNKNFEQTRLAALSLYNLVSRGRNTWQQIQLDKKAAIENYYQYFLANTSAVSGRSSKIQEIIDKAKNSFDFLPDSMMNTAQLFMALASYKPLQPLFEHLRYSLATAQIAREKHLREMRDADLAAFGRILGIEPATEAGYSKKQLKAISKKFDAFFEENNQHHDTGIVIKFESQSADESNAVQTEEYNLACTNWEALYYILAYRQPHYQVNAQLHGFTDNVLKQLQEHIGDKLMSFGEHIQKAIINDGTVPVYEEREGIPMRENPLYFPISAEINTINTTREEPLVNPYHPAGGFDFIKTRVRHHKQIAQKNAYVVYRNSLAERSNYVHLDPIVAPLRSLMARDEFVNRLTSLIGPGLTSQLRQAMKEIIGAGYQETSLQDFSNDKVASALSASTLAVLSGNPSSIIRQASAIANAGLMPGINPQDVLKYMIFMMKKQNRENGAVVGHVSISDVLKLDAFQTRYRDNSYVAEMLSMGNNVKYSTILDITKKAMNAMDTADIWANAVSATIVYNHKYDQLKALNIYSEAQLKKLCEQEVNTYTRLLAQPLHRMDKSAFYWKLSANVFGRAMLYMGSESINKIGMLRSNYIVRRNKGQGRIRASLGVFLSMGLTVGLANFVWESFIAWITGNLPDEDDDSLAAWLIATYTNSAFAQYAEISPFFGQFTRTLFSVFGLYGDNSMKIPGVDTFKRGSKLYTMLTDDKDYSPAEWQRETTRFLREFTAICGFLGGAYSQYRWVSSTAATMHLLTTGNNALYPFSTGIQKGSSFYSDWLNIPDSVLETMSKTDSRKGKRSKSLLEQWLTPKPEQRTIEEIMAEIEKMDLTSQPDALK